MTIYKVTRRFDPTYGYAQCPDWKTLGYFSSIEKAEAIKGQKYTELPIGAKTPSGLMEAREIYIEEIEVM